LGSAGLDWRVLRFRAAYEKEKGLLRRLLRLQRLQENRTINQSPAASSAGLFLHLDYLYDKI